MASKKMINSVESCVEENLRGLVASNPSLCLVRNQQIVVRRDIKAVLKAGKVTLLSGGGAGHEPIHAGYVGQGMLSAAVSGSVFASPPPKAIFEGIQQVAGVAGVLLLVANYTGDRVNFGIAAERAKSRGIRVETVFVGEDCALTGAADKSAGRRGLAGKVFLLKIAGAVAENGWSLDQMLPFLKRAVEQMATLGVCMSPCSVPGAGPTFTLAGNELELGLGVHGEAGVKRISLTTAKQVVDTMLSYMAESRFCEGFLSKDGQFAMLLNNLGSTTTLEINVIMMEVLEQLESRGLAVVRAYSGHCFTSLEMAGFSITVMRVDQQTLQLLDADTAAPAWPRMHLKGVEACIGLRGKILDEITGKEHEELAKSGTTAASMDTKTAIKVRVAIEHACESMIDSEEILNQLDAEAGDGDMGSTVSRGAKGILEYLRANPDENRPYSLMMAMGEQAEERMGGASGAFYGLFFTAAADTLREGVDWKCWRQALKDGIRVICKYGGAAVGDRTMIDPLVAAEQCLTADSNYEQVKLALKSAESCAAETASMVAKAGRASYVDPSLVKNMDPGAHAVALWMRAAMQAFYS